MNLVQGDYIKIAISWEMTPLKAEDLNLFRETFLFLWEKMNKFFIGG